MMEAQTNHKLRKNFYKWHRIIGIAALIPVISWTLSGLSHPFMSNWFRPFIPVEVFKPLTQRQMQPALSLQQVLDQQHINNIRNFGLVNFNRQTYYQVLGTDSTYRYFSATDGKPLTKGDQAYAIFLTRYFTQDSVSKIKRISLQTRFDSQYQPINHLLPVWKVALDRPDGMTLYIETGQSRLGTFNNNTRKAMLGIFEQFHTWQFLADLGGEKLRLGVLLAVVSLMLLSLLTGLTVYGLFWNRFKAISRKRSEQRKKDTRFVHRFHRQLGLIISIIMFSFVVSGGFHLLVKLHNIKPEGKAFAQVIGRKDLIQDNLKLPVPDSLIVRTSLTRFNGHTYYQVLQRDKQIVYVDAASGKVLPDGDRQFAAYLAGYYRGDNQVHRDKIALIRTFDNEYGFINKRLPVEKVSIGNENWYIETATAQLSTKVAGLDRAEGLSFIFLHKYFIMTWAGKDIRDIVSMLAALSVLVVALLGFSAFLNNK